MEQVSGADRYPRPQGLSAEATQWANVRDRSGVIWTVEMVIDPTLPEDLRPDVRNVEDVMAALFVDYNAYEFDMVIGQQYSIGAYDSLTPGAEGCLRWSDRFTYVGGRHWEPAAAAMVPVR